MIHINLAAMRKEVDVMNSKEMLLRKIQAIHIMAVDLQLFLDTHPDNTHALADYKSVTKD